MGTCNILLGYHWGLLCILLGCQVGVETCGSLGITFFHKIRNFTLRCLSPVKCISEYLRHTAGGTPRVD